MPDGIERWELEELEDENARLRAQLLQREDVIAEVRGDIADAISLLRVLLQSDDAPGA